MKKVCVSMWILAAVCVMLSVLFPIQAKAEVVNIQLAALWWKSIKKKILSRSRTSWAINGRSKTLKTGM